MQIHGWRGAVAYFTLTAIGATAVFVFVTLMWIGIMLLPFFVFIFSLLPVALHYANADCEHHRLHRREVFC